MRCLEGEFGLESELMLMLFVVYIALVVVVRLESVLPLPELIAGCVMLQCPWLEGGCVFVWFGLILVPWLGPIRSAFASSSSLFWW